MDTTQRSEAIIKTDVLGRVKTPAARREQLLDEFERSGLSGCKFAELAGIKYSTFATWGQKRRRQNGTYAKVTANRSQRSDSVRLAGGYVQMVETPIEYLEPGHGQTKQGYFWTAHRPGGEGFYQWETSRAASCLDNIIPASFSGKIQCDGYSGYRAFANARKGAVELAGCWAHVRRKFYEALKKGSVLKKGVGS
jgi:hypothetical protein